MEPDYSKVHERERELIHGHLAGVTGRLLEIGAYDGSTSSVSAPLIEAGWSAVLVEPASKPFGRLLDKYAGNERVSLVHAAVLPERGLVKFWETETLHYDQLSSTVDGFCHGWGVKGREYLVSAVSVADLLARFDANSFDLVIVDAEGVSVRITKMLPLAEMTRTKVICVESDSGKAGAQDAVAAIEPWYDVEVMFPNAIGVRRA